MKRRVTIRSAMSTFEGFDWLSVLEYLLISVVCPFFPSTSPQDWPAPLEGGQKGSSGRRHRFRVNESLGLRPIVAIFAGQGLISDSASLENIVIFTIPFPTMY